MAALISFRRLYRCRSCVKAGLYKQPASISTGNSAPDEALGTWGHALQSTLNSLQYWLSGATSGHFNYPLPHYFLVEMGFFFFFLNVHVIQGIFIVTLCHVKGLLSWKPDFFISLTCLLVLLACKLRHRVWKMTNCAFLDGYWLFPCCWAEVRRLDSPALFTWQVDLIVIVMPLEWKTLVLCSSNQTNLVYCWK